MGRKENAVQRSILDALLYKGILAWRSTNTPTPISSGGRITGFRRADPHTVGIPDILCVIPCRCCMVGQLVGIECKAERGVQSAAQKDWQYRLTKHGGRYVLARSWSDVERELFAK